MTQLDAIETQAHTMLDAVSRSAGAPDARRGFPSHSTALSLALMGLLSGTVAFAAGADTARVSIEGDEFRVQGATATSVISDSPEKRVETGQTSQGTPVVITRLSYPDHSLPDQENGNLQQEKAQREQSSSGAESEGGVPAVAQESADNTSAASSDEAGAGSRGTKPFLIHAVTPRSVSIAWAGDRATVFAVSRDGQPIAQTSDGSFVDESVSPSTTYQYTIEAVTTPGTDQGAPLSATFRITTPAADGSETQSAGTDSPVTTKETLSNGPSQTIYTRRTFIPDERVPSGLLGDLGCLTLGQNVAYKGDNRDWDETGNWRSDQSRTVIRLTVDWRRSPARLVREIRVSPTTQYINGREEVRQASANENWVRRTRRRSNYVEVDLDHDIGNPFCIGNSIRYEERVSMWNDGTVAVTGSRRQAPRHEAVVSYSVRPPLASKGPITLLQLDNEGFHCLAPGMCSTQSYNVSGKP